MTPRGVEHAALPLPGMLPDLVEKPMTPRGVEHFIVHAPAR